MTGLQCDGGSGKLFKIKAFALDYCRICPGSFRDHCWFCMQKMISLCAEFCGSRAAEGLAGICLIMMHHLEKPQVQYVLWVLIWL